MLALAIIKNHDNSLIYIFKRGYKELSLIAGSNDFINKPVEKETLAKALQIYFESVQEE